MATIKLILLALAIATSTSSLAQNTAEDYVAAHNAARSALYPLGGVEWDATLAAYAEKYVNRCYQEHSFGPYGENIALGDSSLTGIEAVQRWVDEKPNYDYNHDLIDACVDGKPCWHYTQVVWKNSVRIGCARAVCYNSVHKVFIMCNYDPPGNLIGQKPY